MPFKLNMMAAASALAIGAGISGRLMANSAADANFDTSKTNAFYDMACLYGDNAKYGGNGDGILSDDEYKAFSIDSLAPDGTKGEDPDFRFLGFLPKSDTEMFFYVFSTVAFSSMATGSEVADTSFSFFLQYENGSASDGNGGFANNESHIDAAAFVNSYHSSKGYYCKFDIQGYKPVSDDGNMRIKAWEFLVDKDDQEYLKKRTDDGAELLYTSDAYGNNPVSVYFGSNTYEIKGHVDGWLSASNQVTTPWYACLSANDMGSKTTAAYENWFFFFNFADSDFNVDQISSVTYKANLITYTRKLWNVKDYCAIPTATTTFARNTNGHVYDGRYADALTTSPSYTIDDTQVAFKDYNLDVSSTSLSETTKYGIQTVVQADTQTDLFPHAPYYRAQKFQSIVHVPTVTTDCPGDEYKTFREFISGKDDSGNTVDKYQDHSSYTWAFGLKPAETDDKGNLISGYKREMIYDGLQTGSPATSWSGMVYAIPHSYDYWTTESLCHDMEDVVVLDMHVVQSGKGMDIKVLNDPQSVRYYYSTALPAPSLGDFIINDIKTFLDAIGNYWWVYLIIAIAILLALGLLFKPVMVILKAFWKGLVFIFKTLITILYDFLIWWWLATVRKARGESIPPLFPFDKGSK